MVADRIQRRKRTEAFYFERARVLVGCWSQGEIDASGEEPDIVVTSPSGAYGVEVTEMLRADLRAVEETRRLICEKAQRRFLSRVDADCLDVKVVFVDEVALSPRDQDVAADRLAEIVGSRIRSLPAGVLALKLESGVDFESDSFNAVWLHHHPQCPGARWQPVAAWWVPIASPSDVQAEINRKESKVAAYRERVEIVWLLLVLQGFSGSAAWSIDKAVFSHQFCTTFDGVVLLDYAMNRAHLLSLVLPV